MQIGLDFNLVEDLVAGVDFQFGEVVLAAEDLGLEVPSFAATFRAFGPTTKHNIGNGLSGI